MRHKETIKGNPVTDKITIKIPNWYPTPLNKLLGHWTVSAKRKKADSKLLITYMHHLKPATKKRRVSLTIVLGKGQRACDPDAYFKSLLDGLVHSGQLKNDSKNWAELAPVKFLRGDMATIIELEDM